MVLPVQALALALLRAVVVALAVRAALAFAAVAVATGFWAVLVERTVAVAVVADLQAAGAAQSESSGPAMRVHSHQLIQVICNA